jgi:hypothetical protein
MSLNAVQNYDQKLSLFLQLLFQVVLSNSIFIEGSAAMGSSIEGSSYLAFKILSKKLYHSILQSLGCERAADVFYLNKIELYTFVPAASKIFLTHQCCPLSADLIALDCRLCPLMILLVAISTFSL